MSYRHVVQYYETDAMGITHHSNYIRFMEEARVAYLNEHELPYAAMEQAGIISPVVDVNAKYLTPSSFGDALIIEVQPIEITAVRFRFAYTMKNEATGALVCQGETTHCFLKKDSAFPLALKRECPDFYERFCALISPKQ